MRFSFSNISIKSRFNIFLLAFVVASIILIISFIVTINTVKQYRDYNQAIDKLVIDYLDMRRFEQHFLLRYQEDLIFFSSGENKYSQKHAVSANSIKENITALESDEITEKIGVSPLFAQIKDHQEKYEKIFTEIKNKLKSRGTESIGILGNMNEDAIAAYGYEQNRYFLKYLDRFVQYRKDYLYYRDIQYYKDFLERYADLYIFLDSGVKKDTSGFETDSVYDPNSNSQTDSIIPGKNATINSDFIVNINNFKYSFGLLVELDKEIGLSYESGLMGKLREETQNFDAIEKIREKVTVEQQDAVAMLVNYLYLFFIIIVGVFVFTILRFSKSITEPILQLMDYIKPLSKGKLPGALVIAGKNDELAQMTQSVNDLIAGLRKTTEFATNIGKGVFEDEYEPLSDEDELGNALIEMKENLNLAKIEDEKRKHDDSLRKWANEGLAKFNEILRQSTDNIEILANIVIKELIYFLNANQGGLFILNDREKKDTYLELIATYAFDKERKKNKKIYLGEGLVGTAAIEKETIYLTEIPDSYITITSGLGGSNPTSLLIVPLRVEQEIFGIIEIASFNKFERYEIEFVEKVSESIAASLSITKINTRTAELLKKSQLQTEEMANRELEMRRNFEDLQKAREESARREAEMASILNAIDKTTLVIELDIKGYITSVNKALLDLFDLPYDNLTGQHHSEFFVPANEKEYSNFWKELKEGNNVQHTEHVTIEEEQYWLSFMYAPIKDDTGKILKILSLGVDLTESKKLESELLEQAKRMHETEEEMRQNLLTLQDTQDEMSKKQVELEQANLKSRANEEVLAVAIKKSKEQQAELEKNNLELERREGLLQERLEQVRNTQIRYLEEHQKLQEVNDKLKANEDGLKEALKKSQEQESLINKRNQQLVAGEEELRQNIEELQSTREQLQEQHENIIQINEDLARKEAEIRSRFETVDKNNLVAEYNLNGTLEVANESFLETFGYKMNEIKGKHHRMFLEDHDRRSENYRSFWNGLRMGISYENEYKRLDKTGNAIYFRGIYNPIRDPEGKPYKILEILTNVTNRKLAEAQLKSRMSTIEKTAATIEISYNTEITTVNEIFATILGYPKEEIVGMKHENLMPHDYRESHKYHQLWIDLKRGQLKTGEYEYITKTGESKYINGTFSAVQTADGKTEKFMFIGFDITKLVEHDKLVQEIETRLEKEMQELKQKLQEKEKEIQELKK